MHASLHTRMHAHTHTHVQQFVVCCTLHVARSWLHPVSEAFLPVARPSHVQCGLPLLGDSVYGVRSELIGRQALHAEEVRLARLPCPTPSSGPIGFSGAPYPT
jgi:hypothetical protein